MGEELKKHIFYTEDGTPIDTTTKNIEIATDDLLAKHRKYLAEANSIVSAILRTISKAFSFLDGKDLTKNRAKLLYNLAHRKRTKYLRYMCYLEKKANKKGAAYD